MFRERPAPTTIFDDRESFSPDSGATYLFGKMDLEDRGHLPEGWKRHHPDVSFEPVREYGSSDPRINLQGRDILLRSATGLKTALAYAEHAPLYIDMTAMSHHVWAPLLRTSLAMSIDVRVVYLEPRLYREHPFPRDGEFFDLSERIHGISPLPGFLRLRTKRGARELVVPLLGFEGGRLAFLLEQIQPDGDSVVPVVGVPGFRPEFPFFTAEGNRPYLRRHGYWRAVRRCAANCPFELYYLLEELSESHDAAVLRLGLIGTKPHALGAVLYANSHPSSAELIHDHPVRKKDRTEGLGRLLVYNIAGFATT